MSKFKYDLEFGKEGEGMVRELISSTDDLTIEVKRDRRVSDTENIAIEISYRQEPSGLMTTGAQWWAFPLSGDKYNDEVVILIKTERLKQIVRHYQNLNGTTYGGDGNLSELVLLPLSEFLTEGFV